MAPKVHLICSILPKESKFCIILKHSFRAGIYELSYVVFCQRLALPPGKMWDLSGRVARFFLPMATKEQDRPGQCGPSGSTLALTYGWSWSRQALPMHGDGDGVMGWWWAHPGLGPNTASTLCNRGTSCPNLLCPLLLLSYEAVINPSTQTHLMEVISWYVARCV